MKMQNKFIILILILITSLYFVSALEGYIDITKPTSTEKKAEKTEDKTTKTISEEKVEEKAHVEKEKIPAKSGIKCIPEKLKIFNFNRNNILDQQDINLLNIITTSSPKSFPKKEYFEYDIDGDRDFDEDDERILKTCIGTEVPAVELSCKCPNVNKDDEINIFDLVDLAISLGERNFPKNVETSNELVEFKDIICVAMALGENANKYFPCSCTGCPDINKDDKIDISDMVILTQHINEDAPFYNLNTNNNIVDSDDLRCVGEYIGENPGIFSSCRTCTRKPTDNSCICPENTFKASAISKEGNEVFGCSPIYCNHDVDCETEVRIYGNEIPLFCNRLSNEIFNWRIRQNCGIGSCKGHDYCKEVPEGTGRLCGKKSYVCKEKAWTETVCGDKICEGLEVTTCPRDCYGRCLTDLTNIHCPKFQTCKNGKCEDIDCQCGRIMNNVCIKSQCCSDSDCDKGNYCDKVTGKCLEQKICKDGNHCKPNEACNQGKCRRAFTLVFIGMNYEDNEPRFKEGISKNMKEFLELSPFAECKDKEKRLRIHSLPLNDCPENTCENCDDCINKGRKCIIEKHKELAGFYDKFVVLTPNLFKGIGACAAMIGGDGSQSYDNVVEIINIPPKLFVHEMGHQLGLCHDNCGFPPPLEWDRQDCPNRLDSDLAQEEVAEFIMGYCKRLKYGPNAYNFLKTKYAGEPPNSVGLSPWLTGC